MESKNEEQISYEQLTKQITDLKKQNLQLMERTEQLVGRWTTIHKQKVDEIKNLVNAIKNK